MIPLEVAITICNRNKNMKKDIKQKNIENSEINVSRSTSNGMIKTFFTSFLKKNNKKTMPNLVSGFTLVETMFAVLILTFTIVGMMTIVADSLFAARYARDEITVNYLLQEGVDYIRNDRDTTIFLGSGNLWEEFLAKYNACSSPSGCTIDVLNDVVVNPEQCFNDCPFLYYDKDAASGSFYTYDTNNNVKTNFKRKIIVTQSASNLDEIDVTVTVDWYNGGLSVTRSLKTSLLKWQ